MVKSVLHIGDNDIVGNKFNGHNLSIYLKEIGIKSNHLVKNKTSNSDNTFILPFFKNFTETIIKDKLFIEADIIHLHLIHNTPFDINLLPLFSAIKPTAITLHDPFFTTGHCIHSFDCNKWKSFCADCPRLDIPFEIERDYVSYNFLMKKIAIQNSNICAITASDYMKDIVEKSPVWKGKRIYKLPFGVDFNIFKPADKKIARRMLGINEDDIVLMFRATNNEFKGLEYIKNALSNLKTDKNVTILTVQDKSLLEEFKNKFTIKEYGWISNDEKLAQLYQAADLFLMPSKQEAFGMMAIEAMSSGVPVLSIKGTALETVTNSPQSSLSVEINEYSKNLQYLIDNPNALNFLREKALQFAQKNYDKNIYVQKMVEIYDDIIENHKKHQTEEERLTLNQLQKYASKSVAVLNIEPPKKKKNFFYSKIKEKDLIITKIFGIKFKSKTK